MSTEIIQARGITKRFGALTAVDRVDYSLRENEVAGIIGSNGAGKTTFFNLLTGYYIPDEGSILHKGDDITRMTPQQRVARGVTRTFQLTSTFDNLGVTDNLVLAFFRAHRKSSLLHMLFTTRKNTGGKKRFSPRWKHSIFRTCATAKSGISVWARSAVSKSRWRC